MRTSIVGWVAGGLLLAAGSAQAGPIDPFESCLNVNGGIFGVAVGCAASSGDTPGNVTDNIDTDADAIGEGLGNVAITLNEVGDFFVGLFVDWEIDELLNTFFNEDFGSGGTPAAGQTFEVDEPGFVFGDIYDNFANGSLDGSGPLVSPDDMSLALGWDISLAAGQTAVVNFLLSDIAPDTGFWLSHTDPDSEFTFFFSSTLEITGGETEPPVAVPEPGTLLLIGAGLLGAAIGRRRQPRQH